MDDVFVRPPLDQVAELLAADPDIELAIAFGSTVRGTPRPDSDVDVALLASGPLGSVRKRALSDRIAEITGRPVDLVDLRTAGSLVTSVALRTGTRLVCRNPRAWAELLSRTLLDTADFQPYRERILNERRRMWIR